MTNTGNKVLLYAVCALMFLLFLLVVFNKGVLAMAQQGRDLFSQIGNDILKVVVNRIVPKRTRRGRPKKVAWEDRLANGILSSKIALPALGAWVLWNKEAITGEHAAMVMHYVAANQNTISVPQLYPTSPNWVVKKALQEFGLDVSHLSVTWDEMMAMVSRLYECYEQVKASQAVQAGPGVVPGGSVVEPDWNALLAKMGQQGFTLPGDKQAKDSGKGIDKTVKTK